MAILSLLFILYIFCVARSVRSSTLDNVVVAAHTGVSAEYDFNNYSHLHNVTLYRIYVEFFM